MSVSCDMSVIAMYGILFCILASILFNVSHGSGDTCAPVSMVENGFDDKNKYLFAFSQRGLPFNHINAAAGMKLEGQSVDLVLEVCAYVGICCDVLVVPTTNCWDNSLFPGFSSGLNERSYDFCADMDVENNRLLSYAFSSQPYRTDIPDLRMMVRKDSRALARFWDKALLHFMCSDQYEPFCDEQLDKYDIDPHCVDPSTLDCSSVGSLSVSTHFSSLSHFVW